jgi:hypothetical protein
MIKPTVGRVVLYWPTLTERSFHHAQPFSAQIAHVWGDDCVNLSIIDEHGKHFTRDSVRLAQDREAVDGECEWPPYQLGQVKKQNLPAQKHVAIVNMDRIEMLEPLVPGTKLYLHPKEIA